MPAIRSLDGRRAPGTRAGAPDERRSRMYTPFFRSLANYARATVHVRVVRGRDRHHVADAAVKALGLACREAFAEGGAIVSTSGAVLLEDGDTC